jgi:hypothetical protein
MRKEITRNPTCEAKDVRRDLVTCLASLNGPGPFPVSVSGTTG